MTINRQITQHRLCWCIGSYIGIWQLPRSHSAQRAGMVLNTPVINLAPKVTEKLPTNLEAAASLSAASQPHALRSEAAARFRPPRACLRRAVRPTVCFQKTQRRIAEAKQGCQRPIAPQQQAERTSHLAAPERDASSRDALTKRCRPEPPGEKHSLFPTARQLSRKPGRSGAAKGQGRGDSRCGTLLALELPGLQNN